MMIALKCSRAPVLCAKYCPGAKSTVRPPAVVCSETQDLQERILCIQWGQIFPDEITGINPLRLEIVPDREEVFAASDNARTVRAERHGLARVFPQFF